MHVVQTIRAEVRAPSRRSAKAATERLSDVLRDRLDDALAAQLDALVPEPVTIRCARLELDLGTIPARFDLDDLAARIAAAARRELEKQFALRRHAASSDSGAPHGWPPAEAGSDAPASAEIASAHEAPGAFLHFLEHGALPWWFSRGRWGDEIPERLLERDALQAIEARLGRMARASTHSLIRLLSFPMLVQTLAARHSGPLSQLVARLPPTSLRLALQLAGAILDASALGTDGSRSGPPGDLLAGLCRFVHRLPGAASEARRLRASLDLAAPRSDSQAVDRLRALLRAPERFAGEADKAAVVHREKAEADSKADIRGEDRPEAETVAEPETDRERGACPELFPTDSAGLVLLHPWFPGLFRRLRWLGDRDRFLPGRDWWAVQALFVLAQGRPPADESELVLEKTLCGIDLAAASVFPQLDATVLVETDALLKSAIAHWTVLQNTSPDGLRESFLQRPGLLDLSARPPELRVERRAYDLLLTRLPWSFDPVALPWRSAPLKVTWPTPS